MENNYNEINWLIDENLKLIKIIYKNSKKHFLIKKDFLLKERNTYKKELAFNKERIKRRKKIYKSFTFNIKPYITQLMFNLNHLIKYNMCNDIANNTNLNCWEFDRLRNGEKKTITNLQNAITFYRDAIAHPEHYHSKPSPRANPEYPENYPDLYFDIYPNEKNNDFTFKISEWKLLLIWDINKYLTNLKLNFKKLIE